MAQSKEGYLWTRERAQHGLVTAAAMVSSPHIQDSYDVVVVGAGFAGLVAARDVAMTGTLSVLLIEARDRVGGRTWTAQARGEEFEMGGTWMHWSQPHVYRELSRYGLHQNLQTSSGIFESMTTHYKPANKPQESHPERAFHAAQDRIADVFFSIDGLSSRDLMPYPHDPLRSPALWKKYDHLSIRQRLDQIDSELQHEKDYLESDLNSLGCASGTEIGWVEALRWYALGGHSMAGLMEAAGVFKLKKGGTTSLAKAIMKEASYDKLLETEVVRMEQADDNVTLITRKQRKIQARRVICTIPLNVLENIEFDPPLEPSRQLAISRGHMNKGSKIHFHLEEAESGWIALANGYGSSSFCFAFTDHNGTTWSDKPNGTFAIGFGFGGRLPDLTNADEIISQFHENIRPNAKVQAYVTHDWANDPYAKGTWCCWGPSTMSTALEILQKPCNRIHFASADWADGWRGFIDGAIEQGARAAQDVISKSKIAATISKDSSKL